MKDELFSAYIKRVREEKGFNRKQFAQMLQLSPSTITKWEQSDSVPNKLLYEKIAEVLEINVEELCITIANTKAANKMAKESELIQAEDGASEVVSQAENVYTGFVGKADLFPEQINQKEQAVEVEAKESTHKFKWRALSVIIGLLVVILMLLGVNFFFTSLSDPQMEIVDEYVMMNSEFYGKSLYFVIVDYDGEMTDDICATYANGLREEYEKHMDELDGVIFVFVDEYDGKVKISDIKYKMVFTKSRK